MRLLFTGTVIWWFLAVVPGWAAPLPGTLPYVVLGPGGVAIVRDVVGPGQDCPSLDVDGHRLPMRLRAAPQPLLPENGEHNRFPVKVCEAPLPKGAVRASLGATRLPVPSKRVNRIVVMGDSGCRMKWPSSFQDCDDPRAWPLAQVARSAAAEHPDLVIHVGDYHYREHPCVTDGCADSPSGYGIDTWRADFFDPMRPLLQAAPWVAVRGNHETCARAGQGWFRFLDVYPYDPEHACAKEALDEEVDAPPFAVPLGPRQQLIVFDSSGAGEGLPEPGSAAVTAMATRWREVAALAGHRAQNWLVLHHPVLAYGYFPPKGYHTGNALMTAALAADRFPAWLPDGIQLVLQGHIHTFEINRFQGNQAVSVLAGFAGSQLESPFPKTLPQPFQVAPEAWIAESFSDQQFGYVLLERHAGHWLLFEKSPDGQSRLRCTLTLENTPYGVGCASSAAVN